MQAAKPLVFDLSALLADDDTPQRQASEELVLVMQALLRRKSESLKLYEPLAIQQGFHESKARTRLVKGSNRAGKTLAAAIEMSRAVTNTDPYGKYPKMGTCYLVGDDWDHHGQTVYPKLFVPGAFHVIRDQHTKQLRAFRPWDPADMKRSREKKPAAPLIPQRLIADVAWHKMNKKIPSMIVLKTGWTLFFFSGKVDPPQGAAVDLVWLDEEVPNEKWFPEMNSRIVDRDGKIIWSATPEVGTDQFYELCAAAEEEELLPENFRKIVLFHMAMKDNAHISDAQRGAMESALSDEQRLVKVEGEFALSGRRVYAEYSKLIHGIQLDEVPAGWTNYAAIDPGVKTCAVLFASCPDPADVVEEPFDLLLWDELYISRCHAKKFAEQFAKKVEGRNFEAFIIDTRGSRSAEAGSGLTIFEQFASALKEKEVRSNRTGSSFAWGSDLLKDGIHMVKGFLRPTDTVHRKPRVRVLYKRNSQGILEAMLPNLAKEFERYRYKKTPIGISEDTDERRDNHLMACLRYVVMHRPKYRKPDGFAMMDPVVAAFFKDREREGGKRHTHFGSTGVLNVGRH